MKDKTMLSCAVTGANAAAVQRHPNMPITPKQIADAAIEAAKAGAAVAHIHVRDPETGAPSNDKALYREVFDRIRDSDTDVIINMTTGMDAEIVLDRENPRIMSERSTIVPAEQRMQHILDCRPEMCTLDCGVMAFGGEVIYGATHTDLKIMASLMKNVGVKPELEVFDLVHIENAKMLINEELIEGQPLFQFCLGTTAGAPATSAVISTMKDLLPDGAVWSAFGVGPKSFPIVALSTLMGGFVRVGLEDNLRLKRGVFASNGQLVEKAARMLDDLGSTLLTPTETREMIGLVKQ